MLELFHSSILHHNILCHVLPFLSLYYTGTCHDIIWSHDTGHGMTTCTPHHPAWPSPLHTVYPAHPQYHTLYLQYLHTDLIITQYPPTSTHRQAAVAPSVPLTIGSLHTVQFESLATLKLECRLSGAVDGNISTILYLLQIQAGSNSCTGWQWLHTPLAISTLYLASTSYQMVPKVTQNRSYIGVGGLHTFHSTIGDHWLRTQL